jgi:hypothetical protein
MRTVMCFFHFNALNITLSYFSPKLNVGYGYYSQDVVLHQNSFNGRVHIDRDIDFVQPGNGYLGHGHFVGLYHQHYHT